MSGTLEGLLGTRRRRGGLLDNPDPVEALRESLPAGPQRDEVRMPSPGFRELDTRDPTARMALRAGVGQTVEDTARMYRQALDAAGWGGTMAAGRGIRAYHGSPHQFDRFDMSKVGTGEGAQSYGHGLYFAENEGVARNYRDALSGNAIEDVNRFINTNMGYARSPAEVAERFRTFASLPRAAGPRASVVADDPEAMRLIQRLVMEQGPYQYGRATPDDLVPVYSALDARVNRLTGGNMYEVNLRTSPDRLIDWSAPVSQQPAPVQDALRALGSRVGDVPMYHAINRARKNEYFAGDLVGTDRATPAEMSARLRDAGVSGISYLDMGSRGAGTGTRNYVIFDDALIDILRRYAIPGFLGGGAAAANTEGLLQ